MRELTDERRMSCGYPYPRDGNAAFEEQYEDYMRNDDVNNNGSKCADDLKRNG